MEIQFALTDLIIVAVGIAFLWASGFLWGWIYTLKNKKTIK
jgi:nitrogen fixation-related uncharacterized protein